MLSSYVLLFLQTLTENLLIPFSLLRVDRNVIAIRDYLVRCLIIGQTNQEKREKRGRTSMLNDSLVSLRFITSYKIVYVNSQQNKQRGRPPHRFALEVKIHCLRIFYSREVI